MSVINDASRNWSSGVTLAADEVWQCRHGYLLVSTDTNPDEDDGVLLKGRRGDAITLSSGLTVKYKLASGSEGILTRTVV